MSQVTAPKRSTNRPKGAPQRVPGQRVEGRTVTASPRDPWRHLATPRVGISLALGLVVFLAASSTANGIFEPAPGYGRNLVLARLLLATLVAVVAHQLLPLLHRPRRSFLIVAGVWCCYLGAWLLVTWPGFIMTDTVDVVINARQLIVYEWFSYLHPLATMALLDVVPHLTVVAVVHIVLTAAVLAWATTSALDLGAPRWLVVGANVALAASAPLLTNTLLYSRDTVFALLHVLLALYVAQVVARRDVGWVAAARLAGLVGFLSVYRGDGIALVVVVPALVLLLVRPGRTASLRVVGCLAAALVAFHLVLPAVLAVREQPRAYELSLRMNPLGQVLQSDFYSADRDRDLAQLARVIDVEGVKELSTPYEIPAYWAGEWRQDASEADWAAFTETTDRLLRDNVSTVVAGRVRTFGAASGLAPGGFFGVDTGPVSERHAWVSDLRAMEGEPPSGPLYRAAGRYLQGSVEFGGLRPHGAVLQWNLLPWFAVLVAALALARRHPFAAAAAAVLLCRVPLVFMAAPASQFKYYYSVYLGGAIVLLLLLTGELRRWRDRQAAVGRAPA